MKNKILVLTKDQQEFKKKLDKLNLPKLDIIAPKNNKEIEENIAKANIILGNPPIIKKYLAKAKKLAWVQSSFVGIDSLVDDNLRQDYILTNVKNTYGQAMAEYVFSYILMLQRAVIENIYAQKKKRWNEKCYVSLENKIIGIIGAGSIGKQIAKVAKAFKMMTYGLRSQNKKTEYFDKIFTLKNIKEFLNKSDFVVSVLPNTKKTTNIINKKTLKLMKKSAIFMNIGRGNAVNEDDLKDAVKKGIIEAAVLDVFKKEPLPKNNPLWNLENVYITPHISGYVMSNKIFEIFEENYNRFIQGKKLKYRIDFKKGY